MKEINIKQIEMEQVSNKNFYFSIIESLLFVSGDPLKLKDISEIIECSISHTETILEELSFKYTSEDRGINLIKLNDGYQLVTKGANSNYVQKLLKTNSRQSLSQGALETLAIVAYKQPITRVSIDEIRGVKSDSAIYTLVDKGLIKESGRLEVPGRPILYVTTDEFLRHFGIENIKQMPSLEDILGAMDNDLEDDIEAAEEGQDNIE